MKAAEYLTRYRNTFLLLLLVATLYASGTYNRERLENEAATVSIPVIATAGASVSAPAAQADPVMRYRQQREDSHAADMAALQALCGQESLERKTREDAAERLQALVSQHQSALALEGALAQSGLAPCVAVVTPGNVTIVTGKTEVTPQDTAMVIALAAAHADTQPDGVRILTADTE